MTPMELALTMLGEATAKELHDTRDSQGFGKLRKDAGDAGRIAGHTREEIEQETGRPITSPENYAHLTQHKKSHELPDTPPRLTNKTDDQ